ncbi:MAG: hypothetical protein OHK93_006418 [Ramalina farinacea]|uniref:F-box domain-containing protein n=1 Tax=Ramalina farinacea TaxID=258253 RepID=A0AA43QIJ3_9LECA|nr:hypothetical protein [Ramalina farinacea]
MQSQSISEPSQLVEEVSQLQLSPSLAVYLPSELMHKIYESCDKNTLKSVRLTCRDWNHAVIPLLFDRVFISARKQDLEVFHNITACEHLAANIKELHIDATRAFLDMSEELYMANLLAQFTRVFDRLARSVADSEPMNVIRLQTKGYRIVFSFTEVPMPLGCRRTADFRAYKDSDDIEETHDCFLEVIRESHATYLAMAEAEEEVLHSETGLMSKLQSGVKRLTRLQSVIVDDGIWERHPEEMFATFDPGLWYGYGCGPPAARVRHPMRLHPSPSVPNGTLAANIIKAVADALAVSPRPLKRFCSPIDCRPLDSWLLTDSFSALEYLELNIKYQNSDASTVPVANGSIPGLLSRTQTSLRQLRLEPGGYYHYQQGGSPSSNRKRIKAYAFKNIFKEGLHMPSLVTLSLGTLALRAYKLIGLLRHHCPKLKDLAIGHISLKYGNWPGLLTMFKELQLDHFRLSINATYWLCVNGFVESQVTGSGALQDPSCTGMDPILNVPALTDYVLGAAIHPCYQEYVSKRSPREYHRKVMSAVVCCWPESMQESVVADYHATIGTITVPLESRLNLDWDGMGLTSLLPSPHDSPVQTIKSFMLQNT